MAKRGRPIGRKRFEDYLIALLPGVYNPSLSMTGLRERMQSVVELAEYAYEQGGAAQERINSSADGAKEQED
ncbi:MAG: hypothetical protein U1E51_19410 [Candidatus Binatia bacterium]|nr:hypothetical protein [Candidatus Binatia bacterium]